MKLLIRAALLAASIGSIGTAYAGNGSEGPVVGTQRVIAQAPVKTDRAFAAIQGASGAARFVTQQYATLEWSQNQGAEG